jgi:hypothetical protein
MADIFGQVLRLQRRFSILFVLLLKDVAYEYRIAGKDDRLFESDLYPKDIPEFPEILVMERQRIFKDPFSVFKYFDPGNGMEVPHLK